MSAMKTAAFFVFAALTAVAVCDYVRVRLHNAELTSANEALRSSNERSEELLRAITDLNDKVDKSLSRVQAQSDKLDTVSADVRRIGREAKKSDETYRDFCSTPIHPTSLRMFEQARNSDEVRASPVDSAGQSAEGYAATSGAEKRR